MRAASHFDVLVVDTNVLVAGLLTSSSPPARLVDALLAGSPRLALDARILIEYGDVLSRPKFRFDPERVRALMAGIYERGLLVSAPPLQMGTADPTDLKFVEVALALSPPVPIITGNTRHFAEAKDFGLVVLTPRVFLEGPAET